jgi:hypothetical protein
MKLAIYAWVQPTILMLEFSETSREELTGSTFSVNGLEVPYQNRVDSLIIEMKASSKS